METSGLNIPEDEIRKYNSGTLRKKQLEKIQDAHTTINSRASYKPQKNIVGDILDDALWEKNELQGSFALTYFDIATYETTKIMFSRILPRMSKGGIMVFDNYGSMYPGVSKAQEEEKVLQDFDVEHSAHYPSKVFFTVS